MTAHSDTIERLQALRREHFARSGDASGDNAFWVGEAAFFSDLADLAGCCVSEAFQNTDLIDASSPAGRLLKVEIDAMGINHRGCVALEIQRSLRA